MCASSRPLLLPLLCRRVSVSDCSTVLPAPQCPSIDDGQIKAQSLWSVVFVRRLLCPPDNGPFVRPGTDHLPLLPPLRPLWGAIAFAPLISGKTAHVKRRHRSTSPSQPHTSSSLIPEAYLLNKLIASY